MGQNRSPKDLAKFLDYMLGRRPDEFGLVPDADGWLKIKDLLKAISEEDGWRHVRQAGIDEVRISVPDAPIEMEEGRIRARNRENLIKPETPEELPKLLYTCLRQKAHPVVVEQGITPLGGLPHVVLSSDKEMALRMGRRIDSSPLMLTVQVQWGVDMGVLFQKFGESLYLAREIPVGAFTAPPLPEEKAEPKKGGQKKEKRSRTPGSFELDMTNFEEKQRTLFQKKKEKRVRDKERRQSRREKEKRWE